MYLKIVILHCVSLNIAWSSPVPGWKDDTDWVGGSWQASKRSPQFLAGLATNVSVTIGRTASLPCQVTNLRGRSVSWMRKSAVQVLSTDRNVFTSDTRIQVISRKAVGAWSWSLQIANTTEEDSGIYECQINTRPKLSHPVYLHVIQAGAVIAGPSEVYVHAGSRLFLTCWIHAPPKPPGPLIWIHNGTILDSMTPRGGLSLHIAVEGARASTRLSLLQVSPSDAGNYTCSIDELESASVTVFVLKDEAPAAMHHDGSCTRSASDWNVISCLCITMFLRHPISNSMLTHLAFNLPYYLLVDNCVLSILRSFVQKCIRGAYAIYLWWRKNKL